MINKWYRIKSKNKITMKTEKYNDVMFDSSYCGLIV